MYILTLSVPIKQHLVHAHYVRRAAHKNDGGMLATVYPGGSFGGYSFEALVRLGSGRHDVIECDERDHHNCGQVPEYASERKKQLAWFEAILFGHQQGLYTSLEILHAAGDVLNILALDEK